MRSLSPSKAVFYYETKENEFNPLKVEDTTLRCQQSGYTDGYNKDFTIKKLDEHTLAQASIHRVESCFVPISIQEVYCRFSLRVNAHSLSPEVCNSDINRQELSQLAKLYKDKGGYKVLALKIAINILRCNWLWRNKNTCPTSLRIRTTKGNIYHILDCVDLLSLKVSDWEGDAQVVLEQFSDEIAHALSHDGKYWSADIKAKLLPTFSHEIFPSQKFIENKGNGKEQGNKSRILATTLTPSGYETVCMTGHKVGAALQFIDTWWDDNADYAVRVNEYGIDQKKVIPLRTPAKGNDFYTYFNHQVPNFIEEFIQVGDADTIPPSIHYFMSVLVRGGMFQTKSEKVEKKKLSVSKTKKVSAKEAK